VVIFNVKVERFAKGAGNPDIMIMVLIFVLAGAFSETAKVRKRTCKHKN
jgi:Na+/H+ antiporter NhaC